MRQFDGTYRSLVLLVTAHAHVMASEGTVPAARAAPLALGVSFSSTLLATAVYVTSMTPVVASTVTLCTFVVLAGEVQPSTRLDAPFSAFSATVVSAADARFKPSVTRARMM